MNEEIITTTLEVNGTQFEIRAQENTPLLWILRDYLQLKATKYGCGKGLCGSCSIHRDGELVRSCSTTLGDSRNAKLKTIEGVNQLVKDVWINQKVMQCGYCQPGQIMCALSLLKENPNPNDEDINSYMTNLCRCGTYPKIKSAIKVLCTLDDSTILK